MAQRSQMVIFFIPPETNSSPMEIDENRPATKGNSFSNPSVSGAMNIYIYIYILVSGSGIQQKHLNSTENQAASTGPS